MGKPGTAVPGKPKCKNQSPDGDGTKGRRQAFAQTYISQDTRRLDEPRLHQI
jgi:hypothetical protein